MSSFSLRNPYTIIVGALITVLFGVIAFSRMPVDVFPDLKIPAVVVATFYSGMPPLEMERNITTRFERFFTLGSDIEHIESRSLPGVSIIKVFFQPNANVDVAASSLANLAMADLRHLPPGTLPPLVLKFDASSLPVTIVTASGTGFSEAQLRDQAQYNIRNQLATIPGASVPPPFGGKYRQVMVYVVAPLGSRIEVTEALAKQVEDIVHQVIPASDLATVVANIGLAPGFSAIYSPNASSDSGFIMVSLTPSHHGSTWDYTARLQTQLQQELPQLQTFFQSGSIIDSVLNFGLAAPIDVQFSGPDYHQLSEIAQQAKDLMQPLPQVGDTFIPQEFGYPTLRVNVDRVKAARLGLSQKDVVTNVITALTSNQMIAPSIWIDPKNGNDYFLTAQYPEGDIRSLDTLLDIPVRPASDRGQEDALLLRNVATITREAHPAEGDHYNIQRVVDVLVTPRGDDMGGTQAAIQKALARLQVPKGVNVSFRGSVSAMQASFASFGFGLAMAVLLLYLVLVAQFRSFLDPR